MNGYLRFRDRFADALDQRLYTIDDLDAVMLSGRGKCWVTETAAIVAEIKTFPTGAKAVCGVIAAGPLEEIETILIPAAEEWGRSKDCAFGMIESRPGWAKRMKKHGYETFQVSLIKEL
jgi:hypothetical protein